MIREKSLEVYRQASKITPGGVNSPVRSFRHLDMNPMIAESGVGAKLFDLDGHSYIDFCCSWGALILGHAHPGVTEGVTQQLKKGTSFGVSTEIEMKLAAKVTQLLPHVEQVRFVNSGTEATMTAMRLARGFTERTKVIKFSGHYHGHSDALLMNAGSGAISLNPLATSLGINPSAIADTICLPFNDFDALRAVFQNIEIARDIAAVIVEPVAGNMGVVLPEPGFLEMIREETAKINALLIFDEVITGFRVGLRGAAGLLGIKPDLTCLGKIIGGGFPVAAVGGRKEILECLAPIGQVYQAGTLSGNPVGMRGGLETLQFIEQEGFYDHLDNQIDRLVSPIESAIKERGANACIQRAGSMFTLFFGVKKVTSKADLKYLDEKMFIRYFKFLFEKGIYISPSSHESCFISAVHQNQEIDYTADCIVQFIKQAL